MFPLSLVPIAIVASLMAAVGLYCRFTIPRRGHVRAALGERDLVVLTTCLPQQHLEVGDVGTVVRVCDGGGAFEVEFATLRGQVTAVVAVDASAVRPVTNHEITHARELTTCRP